MSLGALWVLFSWGPAFANGSPLSPQAAETTTSPTDPGPMVSIQSTGPILTEHSDGSWWTSVLVANGGGTCANPQYALVPIVPNRPAIAAKMAVPSTISTGPPVSGVTTSATTKPTGGGAGTPPPCVLPANEVVTVTLEFTGVPSHLSQAALVLKQPGAPPGSTGTPAMTLIVKGYAGTSTLVGPVLAAFLFAVVVVLITWGFLKRLKPGEGEDLGPVNQVKVFAVASTLRRDVTLSPLTINPRPDAPVTVSLEDEIKIGPAPGQFEAGRQTYYQPINVQARPHDPYCRTHKELVYASASWTFTDSWLTNVTAIGVTLSALLTALGVTSTVLPGVQTGRFSILLAVFGVVLVAPPLLLGITLPRSDQPDAVKGTVGWLLAAAFVTLLAVGGELGTVAVLVWLANATVLERCLMESGLVAAAGLIGWYACRSIVELVAHSRYTGNYSSAMSAGKDSSLTL